MPEINIIVKARDEASKVLGDVSGSMESLEANAKKAIVPLGAISAAGTAIIGKMTMTAARTEELGVVIENLGRVSGYSQEELTAIEESITTLGITTQGARTIMARFMGAELDLADAAKIARAAQDLAVIGMQDSSEAAETLTYALASMQPRVLRQYGLFVNLNEVYKKTADALGKDVIELTEAEQRQGMLNAVLEQAANFTGTYEAAMSTAGKQMRSFHRYTEELSNQFGEFMLPLLSAIIEGATNLAKGLLNLPAPIKGVIVVVGLLVTAWTGFMAAASGFVVLAPTLGAAWAIAMGPIGWVATAIVGIGAAIVALYMAWQNNWGGIQDKVRTVWEFISPVFEAIKSVLSWLAEIALTGLRMAWENVWSFIRDLTSAVWKAIQPHFEELQAVLRSFWEEMQPRLQEAWTAIQIGMQLVGAWIQATLIPILQELWDRLEPVREIVIKVTAAFAGFMASAFIAGLKAWLTSIIALWDAFTAAVNAAVTAIQWVAEWLDLAIEKWRAFLAISGARGAATAGPGGGVPPGLQGGLAYVPTTMPAILHTGKAVLTRQQAERWRTGGGGQAVTINNYIAGVHGIDGFGAALDEALRDARRFSR